MKIEKNIAKQFTDYMKKYPKLYEDLAKLIKKVANDKNNEIKILDLGSGPALINKEIKKILPNSIIYSLDQSSEMLKNAQNYTFKGEIQKINGILSNAENIPLKSDSMDIIISRFSLSYWENPNLVIKEIKRVLKPDGKLILEFLNKKYPKWKLNLIKIHMRIKFAGNNVIKYHIDAYKNAYDLDKVKELINKNKLTIIKINGKKRNWKYTIVSEFK